MSFGRSTGSRQAGVRAIALPFVLVIAVALTACGGSAPTSPTSPPAANKTGHGPRSRRPPPSPSGAGQSRDAAKPGRAGARGTANVSFDGSILFGAPISLTGSPPTRAG